MLWGHILSSEWGQILKPSHKADALVSVYGVPLEEIVFTPFLESMEGQDKKCQSLATVWSRGDFFIWEKTIHLVEVNLFIQESSEEYL